MYDLSKMSDYQKTVYGQIIDGLVKMLEENENNQMTWEKPWDSLVGASLSSLPRSGIGQQRIYKSPINKIVLSIHMNKMMQERPRADGAIQPRYFTFASIAKQSAEQKKKNDLLPADQKEPVIALKPGAKGVCILSSFRVTEDRDGNPLDKPYTTTKYTYVYHESDVVQRKFEYDEHGKPLFVPKLDKDGNQIMKKKLDEDGKPVLDESGAEVYVPAMIISYTDSPLPAFNDNSNVRPYTHDEQYEIAEAILANSKATIMYDQADQAFYQASKDEIHLPPREAFPALDDFYSTALHELAHWTGHEDRLNRSVMNRFGSPEYAKEELRAELASTFLSADTGLPLKLYNHAAYVKNWIQILKDNKFEFVAALRDAEDIAESLKEYAGELIRNNIEEAVNQPKNEIKPATPEDEEALQKKQEAIKQNPFKYKYFLTKEITPLDIPPNIAYYDAKDGEFGAVYYDNRLSAAEIKDYQLKQDQYHMSNNLTGVVVYSLADNNPFKGKTFADISSAATMLEFNDNYQEKFHKNFANNRFDLGNLNNWFEKNSEKTGGIVLQTGDIVRVNDQMYFVDGADNCFVPVKLVTVDGKEKYVFEDLSADAQARKQAAVAAVGADIYQKYQQQYQKMFTEGNYSGKGYGFSLRESGVNYGISSLTPTNEIGWKDFDRDYIKAVIVRDLVNKEFDIGNLKKYYNDIQFNSPYAKVAENAYYGQDIVADVINISEVKELRQAFAPERGNEETMGRENGAEPVYDQDGFMVVTSKPDNDEFVTVTSKDSNEDRTQPDQERENDEELSR